MTMMQEGFCGNCGLARAPQAVVCPRCGMPYEASGIGYDPTTPPPQASWQSSPTYFTGSPPHSVPASRWTTRVLIGQSVVIVVLLAVILVVLLHPFAGGNTAQPEAGGGALIPATATAAVLPTRAPTPTYASGLASSDINVFVQSLGDALQHYDGVSISSHVVMPFLVVCAEGSGYQGPCDTSWAEVQNQITTRTLLLDMLTQGLNLQNWYTLATYCPGVVTTDTYVLIGTFEQETGMPLAHLGRAVLGIACSCGSSPAPLLDWQAVYFC